MPKKYYIVRDRNQRSIWTSFNVYYNIRDKGDLRKLAIFLAGSRGFVLPSLKIGGGFVQYEMGTCQRTFIEALKERDDLNALYATLVLKKTSYKHADGTWNQWLPVLRVALYHGFDLHKVSIFDIVFMPISKFKELEKFCINLASLIERVYRG